MWCKLPIADSAREKVSEVLRVRVQQITRFGIPWMEAWHRVTDMPGTKRERPVEPVVFEVTDRVQGKARHDMILLRM
jgi:hypothetical protein